MIAVRLSATRYGFWNFHHLVFLAIDGRQEKREAEPEAVAEAKPPKGFPHPKCGSNGCVSIPFFKLHLSSTRMGTDGVG